MKKHFVTVTYLQTQFVAFWVVLTAEYRYVPSALVRVIFSRNRKKYDDMTGLIKYKLIYLRVDLPAPLLATREAWSTKG